MITPSFSITATERVLPRLALDFTTASLDSRVTFTRTTGASNPATYVDSNGIVASATNNQARFDYNPVTLVCKGLLVEESRSNLFLQSATFNNTAWTANGLRATVTPNATTSPDGTVNAAKLVEDTTASNTHYIQQRVTTSLGSYAYTIYAKAGERTQIALYLTNYFSPNPNAVFNLSTGAVVSSANGTASIENAGNGWYRCTLIGTNSSGTGAGYAWVMPAVAGSVAYTGNGTSGVYIWGAQLEAGTFSTSYIPTTTTALTRNPDVATMTGTNFSNWWQATTGASTCWLIPKSTSTLAYLSFDDNTANNKIVIANSTTSGQSKITSGGSLQATLTAGTITANTTNKVGCSWNTNDCAATANATSPATTASATIPTVTQLRIGSDGTNYANAWVQKIMYWPQRVTNNEIQAFSK